jgi:hypothetical protein
VAVGDSAGYYTQGLGAVGVGAAAGFKLQGTYAVALGYFAGNTNQGVNAVAVGLSAGADTQGNNAVAIGGLAGYSSQGINAVAIGYLAGNSSQGQEAVAIGYGAGQTSQATRSIIINATGAQLNQTTADTFTVAPVRNDVANVGQVMFYNTTSKEVTYGNVISVAGNITGNYFKGNIQGTIGDILNVTSTNLTVTNISAPNPGNAVNIGAGGNNNLVVSNVLVQVQNVPLSVAGNVTGGNILTGGLISATGNVSGNFILGNGSQLTGIVASPSSNIVNGNSNVSVATSNGNVTVTSNGTNTWTFDTTGNLVIPGTSGGLIKTVANGAIAIAAMNNGTDNPAQLLSWRTTQPNPDTIVSAYANSATIMTDVNGTAKTWTFSNIGNLSAPGSVSATGNVTGGNILTGGLISATGNVTAGNISATGNVTSANTLNAAGLSLSGNVVSALTSAANITTTANITGGNLSVTGNVIGNISFTGANITINNAPGGNEGAELFWALPALANTVLNTSLVQDVFQNGMRFFESGGNSRGLYMDLGNAPNGSGTAVGYRDIPQVSFSANSTIAATDAGRHYYSVSASNLSLTIANNTSVAWPVGTAITIVNAGTASILINQGTGVSMYQAGNATAGNRVLATFGMATIMNTAANTWFINGTGLS